MAEQGEATGTTIGVTGLTAINVDVSERLTDALVPYLAVVVGLAFVLLMLVFRSILVPLTAALGFLLFRTPHNLPAMVQLLSESYNPHVRYGAAMALGIACAGTGLDAALDLLEPMTKDPVDFVRQGACMALAMVLVQQNDTLNPRVSHVRKTLERMLTEKHEEAMAKFGATLAQGLLDVDAEGYGGLRRLPWEERHATGSVSLPAGSRSGGE